MKKRVLLTVLFVMLLSLLVAFSVSAQEYELVDDLGDPSWYTGNYQYMTDKTSQVILSNDDGTYTAYPAYYILKYSITVKDSVISEAYINGFDYSHVNQTGKNYTAGAIYKIELPEGLTKITNTYFGHNPKEPNVTEIVMSDTITTISSHAFRETTNLKKVVLSKNLTEMGAYAFYKCKGLEEIVFTAGSDEYLDVSESNIFDGCTALKELDLSTRKIRVLGSSFLSGCSVLGKVTLPESLEEIGYCSIYNCPKLYFASNLLPKNLKRVGFHFLSGCKSINSVLFFPDGFESFTQTYNFSNDKEYPAELTIVFLGKMEGTIPLERVHASNRRFNIVFTQNTYADLKGSFVTACDDGTFAYVGKTADENDTNYIAKDGTLELILGNPKDANSKYKVDENGDTLYYFDKNYSINIYLCGDDNVEVCYNVRSTQVVSGYANFITTPFEFDRQGHMDAGVHYDLNEIISEPSCGDNGVARSTCVVCDRVAEVIAPATGNHTLIIIGPCTDKCSVCTQYVQRAEQSHDYNKNYTYANGYLAMGAFDITCKNEGCSYHDAGELNPIFKDFKYSVREGDKFGLVMEYDIDTDALTIYEAGASTTVKFGVVAIAEQKYDSEKDLVKIDGSTEYANVIVADVSKNIPKTVTLLISGAESQWNQYKETPFYILGYAVNAGTVEYFQNTSKNDVVDLTTISYVGAKGAE